MSRVLLIHPRRRTTYHPTPHLGLAMLSSVLKQAGHEVQVLDYVLLSHIAQWGVTITPSEAAREFRPDIIGITLYTGTMSEYRAIIEDLNLKKSKIPLMVGGPHATINADTLYSEPQISYIFRGEAELVISEVVASAKVQDKPIIIDCPLPDPACLPPPDFTSFMGFEEIENYPLSTSRGCPFFCSFCAVHLVSSRKWRPRTPESCVQEVQNIAPMLPKLRRVEIVDDCPIADLDRFKNLLRLYIERKVSIPLSIDNIRAKGVDRELLTLAKRAGVNSLCIGIEHGDETVFELVGKGETLNDIRKAAEMIKSVGLELETCFIIGLPGDSFEKTKKSIKLAKELGPKHIYWNMVHPFKGTKIRDWYLANNGTIKDDQDYVSYMGRGLRFEDSIVETPEFTGDERKKAHFLAVMETGTYNLILSEIPTLFKFAYKHRLLPPLFLSTARKLARSAARRLP